VGYKLKQAVRHAFGVTHTTKISERY